MIKVGLWQRNGIYYLRWRQNGKQHKISLGHNNKELAQSQARQKEAQLAQICKKGKFQRSLKIATLCENYLMANRRIEPATCDLTKRVFSYLISVLGDIEICKVGYAEAEKFQNWIIETGRAKTTANIWIKTARPAFRWAMRQKLVSCDPFDNLSLFRIGKKRVRIYSSDEFAKILAACPNELAKARVVMAKTTGMRRSEILNLTTDDIDFEKKTITVQAKSETKDTWAWRPKDKDFRTLPMTAGMAVMLNRLILVLPDKQIYPMLSAERFAVIMERKRQGRLTDRLRVCPDEQWSKQFRKILDKVGITAAKFHNMRSTCITEWLESGLAPHEAKDLAGHADIKTTMEHYTAVRDSVVDKARTASEKNLAIAK